MNETTDGRMTVYEIGYLIASSVPEEKVPSEAEAVRKIITDAGASVIAEEAPHRQVLAYTIRRKTLAGSYDSYDSAHFGWVKFETTSAVIEGIKKAVELHPSVLRMLLITTVRDNTFLGKRASALAEEVGGTGLPKAPAKPEERKEAPATMADMDKSIDALVKEA